MSAILVGSTVCYTLATLVAFAFSLVYLTRSEFMPYHREAVESDWDEVDPKHQVLFLALMRVAGGGWLAVGVSMAVLLVFPFRARETWVLFALPAIGLTAALSTLYAVLYVKRNSRASPPVNLVLVAIALLIVGFVLSMV